VGELISMKSDREAEAELDKREKALADERIRQYRCDNLFWRLWGIPMELAELIAEAVWETRTYQGTRCYHRNPMKIVEFKKEKQ